MNSQAFTAALILAPFAGLCLYTLIHVTRNLRK
jgi:hypothetical protein